MKRKRGDIRGTFGNGKGGYLRNAVRDSAAYRTLTHAERCVLADMLRAFGAASSGDTVSIAKTGMRYTYADCREPVDERTFTTARRRICEHGFFREADELKSIAADAPNVYVPCTEWVKFIPRGRDARRLEIHVKRKAATLRRGRERNASYRRNRGRKP